VSWLLRFVSASSGTLGMQGAAFSAKRRHRVLQHPRAARVFGGVVAKSARPVRPYSRPIKTSVALTSTTTGSRATTFFREGTDE
jgi:hypothetical protein